ncbi:MAG TPA: hypothetical protein PLN56_05060 [Methanoregulaceae archaeon]|nr:hypothetical protein [Methanoregulaceae archaeon]HPD10351.1 hypothetical protein [Methanoregulaceae archaeon]
MTSWNREPAGMPVHRVGSGRIALSGERAGQAAAAGHDVILVREKASPDDLPGNAAQKKGCSGCPHLACCSGSPADGEDLRGCTA